MKTSDKNILRQKLSIVLLKNYLQFYSWFGVSDVNFVGKSQETFSTVLFSDQLYRTWSQEVRLFILKEFLQLLFSSHLTSRDPNTFWTSGQWMTEKEGGSDVG